MLMWTFRYHFAVFYVSVLWAEIKSFDKIKKPLNFEGKKQIQQSAQLCTKEQSEIEHRSCVNKGGFIKFFLGFVCKQTIVWRSIFSLEYTHNSFISGICSVFNVSKRNWKCFTSVLCHPCWRMETDNPPTPTNTNAKLKQTHSYSTLNSQTDICSTIICNRWVACHHLRAIPYDM